MILLIALSIPTYNQSFEETLGKGNHPILVHLPMEATSYTPLIHTNHSYSSMISAAIVSIYQMHYRCQE